MTRNELHQHYYSHMRVPLRAAMEVISARYSPEAGGYKEFPDGGSPTARSEAEWAAVITRPEQRDMYLTWYRILHEAKSFANAMQWIRDESMPVKLALENNALRLSFIDKLQQLCDARKDAVLIAQLKAAHMAAEDFIREQLKDSELV